MLNYNSLIELVNTSSIKYPWATRSWYVALLQINIANILQKLFTVDKFLCKIDANSQQQFYTKMNQYFLFRIILAVDKGSVVEGCNSFTYINIGLMKTCFTKMKILFSSFNFQWRTILFCSIYQHNTCGMCSASRKIQEG